MSYSEALERLKNIQHGREAVLTEPTKAPFVSNVSCPTGAFENFNASVSRSNCQSEAFSNPASLRPGISESPRKHTDRADADMPNRYEIARTCRLVVADYPSIDPERLRRFLQCAE